MLNNTKETIGQGILSGETQPTTKPQGKRIFIPQPTPPTNPMTLLKMGMLSDNDGE